MISCIYYMYFIKKRHFSQMLSGILKPKSVKKFMQLTGLYFVFLFFLPLSYQILVRYFSSIFSSIPIVKLFLMVDALILLFVAMVSLWIYAFSLLIVEFSSKRKEK
ncbi:hypothetical protein SAG0144_10915 [Streptococcus agalactiae MRI Z1-035]|nr:hypothetical protein SAG0144_10915 [Streptococcus agalactiae MRI Z1-035]